jgi:hypothetical protein
MNEGLPPVTGSWTHSFEEDKAEYEVYRPTDTFPFPLSRRGRETLEFSHGGEMRMEEPGPDDRLYIKKCTWSSIGKNRFVISGVEVEGERIVEILDAKPDLLKIRHV